MRNNFEWIHSSLGCDNWIGRTALFFFFLFVLVDWHFIIGRPWLMYKPKNMVVHLRQIDGCCMCWVLCNRGLCSAPWSVQLLSCFTGFSWATVSEAPVTEQSAVWEPQFWITGGLRQCLIWMLWQLVWILRFLPRQDKLDFLPWCGHIYWTGSLPVVVSNSSLELVRLVFSVGTYIGQLIFMLPHGMLFKVPPPWKLDT